MSDGRTDALALAASLVSTYKVRGQFAAADGASVLGYNTAGSGTPVGVQGVVDDPDGYGIETPDDARVEGSIESTSGHTLTVDGRARLRLGRRGFNDDGAPAGGNVVGGWSGNSANDAVAATISGGGGDSNFSERENQVTDNYGTVGGGQANRAGDAQSGTGNAIAATVGGGEFNTASGEGATIGGGSGNDATAFRSTIAGGDRNTATDRWTVIGGGDENTVDGDASTVAGGTFNEVFGSYAAIAGGDSNTAIGSWSAVGGGANNQTGTSGAFTGDYAVVPGGQDNLAADSYTFAAGRKAKAEHEGAFVWSDSADNTFSSSGSNQFLIDAGGGVAVGTQTPAAQFEVFDVVSSSGTALGDHVAGVVNSDTTDGHNVLAVQTSVSGPTDATNLVTFRDRDGPIGAIEGQSDGTGITLNTSGADFAEYLPRRDGSVELSPGDVVGVHDGELARETDGADTVLVVSEAPAVTGNAPGVDPEDREDHDVVAFVGQVPARVRGPVTEGDLIVPTGDDGTARALDPAEWTPGDGPLVGRAWERDESSGVSMVTVAVGISDGDVLDDHLEAERERVDDLEAENERLRADVETLEAENDALRDRLARVESALGIDASPSASADD